MSETDESGQNLEAEQVVEEREIEEIAKSEFETEYVKRLVEGKQKKLFERVKKAGSYTGLVQGLSNEYSRSYRNVDEAIRKIEENEKKMTELFEGRNTFIDMIRLYWNKLINKEYTEKEFYIDKLIRNSKEAVDELESKLKEFRATKEELRSYYEEKQQLKIELSQSIDDYKSAIGQLDIEIEKYKRDYNRLEKQGEYGLRDTLEVEIDKMMQDRRTLDTQLKIASHRLVFMENTAQVIDALYEQAESTLSRIEIFKSSAEDYIKEAEQMKDVMVKLSKIVKVTGAVQKYANQIQNAMNKGLDLLSQNLDIIMKSISTAPSEFYSENTAQSIMRRNDEGGQLISETSDNIDSIVQDIRKKPGKYSTEKTN
ncbi:MAG: hypothetical protein QXT20_00640 [Candidatus Woesearchaeota archaeon]